jgi:hypothetical protein
MHGSARMEDQIQDESVKPLALTRAGAKRD